MPIGNMPKMKLKSEDDDRSIDVAVIDDTGEMGTLVFASQGFVAGFMDDYSGGRR